MKIATRSLTMQLMVFNMSPIEQRGQVMSESRSKEETQQEIRLELRFEVSEAARILRMSRAQLYNRIHDGALKRQKDGARTYVTRAELERYVEACGR